MGLIVDTIGVDHLLDLQREGDRRAEAHGTGSRLAWYRAQLLELVGHAGTVGADWAQAVPNWVARWINTETPHAEMRRRRAQGATINQIAAEHATTAAQAHRIITNTSPLPDDDDDNPECRECGRVTDTGPDRHDNPRYSCGWVCGGCCWLHGECSEDPNDYHDPAWRDH